MKESMPVKAVRWGVLGMLVFCSDYLCFWLGSRSGSNYPLVLMTALATIVLVRTLSTPFATTEKQPPS